MTFTGLTPTIDSLNSYKHCWIKYGSGSIYDVVNASAITMHSSSVLQRNGEYINGDNSSTVAIPDFTAGAPINVFIRAKIDSIGSSNGHFLIKINTSVHKGFFLKVDSLRRLQMTQYCEDSSYVSNTVSSAIELGEFHTYSAEMQSNSADGVRTFIDGVQSGASGNTTGKTIRHLGAEKLYLFRYASNQLCRGVVSDVLIFQNVILTPAQHLLIADELNNQIKYEQKSITINGSWSAGQPYWIARYGILAGETTMSAGQILGQLDTLKVSTGTHKCSTFLYGTTLAKGIQCVTTGNIILPNPRPELGGTYYYKYYTAATTSWADATSATPTVTLAAAGDRILWATYDGKTCLYKAA